MVQEKVLYLISSPIFLTADEGQVLFEGNPVQNLPPHQIARLGFLRTFQVARVLSRLTVLENMLLGTQNQIGEHLFSVLLQPKKNQETRERE